jgi:hypothetical protein
LYVKGVLRYRTRSSAHKARTRVLGVYEFERCQLFFALFDLESQNRRHGLSEQPRKVACQRGGNKECWPAGGLSEATKKGCVLARRQQSVRASRRVERRRIWSVSPKVSEVSEVSEDSEVLLSFFDVLVVHERYRVVFMF